MTQPSYYERGTPVYGGEVKTSIDWSIPPATPEPQRPNLGPAPAISDIAPMAATLGTLGPSAVAEISEALRGGTTAIDTARGTWRGAGDLVERINALLNGDRDARVGNPLAQIRDALTDATLTDVGREQRVEAIMSRLRGEVERLAGDLSGRLDKLETGLRTDALPAKPAGSDAAVRISDAKADLRMIFDALGSPGAVVERASELLSRALADQDDALAWLLTSAWPQDYLRSRFPDVAERDGGEAIAARLGSVLDQHGGERVERARAALTAINSPHAAGALRALLAQVPKILDRLEREARLASR